MSSSEADGACRNLRIVDFTWVLAGPYATRILADFGAEVIKVQSRETQGAEETNLTGYFNTWNRNKLGITLNLSKPAGVEIAKTLIMASDVVVENFTPRVMDNWGLDYSSMSQEKPDLIMLSMSGMGHTGPWRNFATFGPTIQAFCGLTHLTTFPGQPPMGLGYSYADHIAGLMAALAILEALEYRHKTGKGQFIDLSEFEAMCTLLGVPILDYAVNQTNPTPVGNGPTYCLAAPHNVYRCLGDDRWCAICVFTENEWQNFCHAIGNPSWTRDSRFTTLSKRQENAAELDALIEEWTTQHVAEDIMMVLQQAGVAAGIVQDARDLSRDPQLNHRGFFTDIMHPVLGHMITDGTPIKLSSTPAKLAKPAPLIGQDNDYVYRQVVGLSEEEITHYKQECIFD